MPHLVRSSAFAATLTVAFVVVITVWGELSPPLKDWLKNLTGHHWTSKSVLSILLYVIALPLLYAVPPRKRVSDPTWAIGLLLASVLLGTVVLTAFYTAHHFGLL